MKKGFTLIELLVIIAILGIIMMVAAPKIINIIEISKIEGYRNNEESILRAAKYYFTENYKLLPKIESETIEVTFDTLKKEEYIEDIELKSSTCNGYVLVTNIGKNIIGDDKFTYIPHLKCEEDNYINSYQYDDLVLHYTFDDFQEPTENLINDGIVKWNVGNLSTVISSYPIVANSKYRIVCDSSTSGTFRFYVPESILIDGEYYTLAYNYAIQNGEEFRMSDWSDMILQNEINLDYKNFKYSEAGGLRSDYNSTFRFMDFYISNNTSVEIWDVQLEHKNYATPFVNGTREGVVKDYSINNNNVSLNINTTPRWLEENNNGYYYFDGNDDFITLKPSNELLVNNNQWTLSSWVNASSIGSYNYANRILALMRSSTASTAASLTMGDGKVSLLYANADTTHKYLSSNIDLNKWYHVVATFNDNHYDFYVNGDKKTEIDDTFQGFSTGEARIGAMLNNSDEFNGYIDDVRVYNRALSENEIKYQYDINKYKYK